MLIRSAITLFALAASVTAAPTSGPITVLQSDGANILAQGQALVSKYESATTFAFTRDGRLEIEISGRSFSSGLQVAPAGSVGLELQLQSDGMLIELDGDGFSGWNSTVTGNGGPDTMSVEGDRKARVRDGNGNSVWDFPAPRSGIYNLNSDAMSFIRTGEKLLS
ncbi:hypothetical protein HKX48_000911 [Thoreauomyces humboldtii]|nr:hypothetical protein HKX48_000911 [Thoreauomyces humboldtii]